MALLIGYILTIIEYGDEGRKPMKVKDLLGKMIYKDSFTDMWIVKTTGVFHYDEYDCVMAIDRFGDNDVDYWYIHVDSFCGIVELNIRIK